MKDPPAGIMRPAPVIDGRLDILGEGFRAGIELPGPPSLGSARHREAQPRVAGLAKPAEISRRVVPLVAVDVVHNEKAG